jgi:hypothetical protein
MSDNTQDPDKLLTTVEAASLIGMSPVYIHDRAVGRKLPLIQSYRFGNRLRFKREDILQYAADHAKKV